MRKKQTIVEQAKNAGSTVLEALKPMATTAAAAVKTAQESKEAQNFVKKIKSSPEAIQALGVLAFSSAATVISPIVTWAACTDDSGSCSTSMAKTFVTTAVLTGSALYAAKRYMPSLFTTKEKEQEMQEAPTSPATPK